MSLLYNLIVHFSLLVVLLAVSLHVIRPASDEEDVAA